MAQGNHHLDEADLSELCKALWKADKNRLVPGNDYRLDLQGRAGYVSLRKDKAKDYAQHPLFTFVDENHLHEKPTYHAFIALLDNYETATGICETVTSEEKAENSRFLDAILHTEVMEIAHPFLVKKNLASADPRQFKWQLYKIWFDLYGRGTGNDSSGFEHVFVGETRKAHEVIGFHNWIQFYLQEKRGNVDYLGHHARRSRSRPDEEDHLLTLQFSWKQAVKPKGSSFIGTSPEFEMALYTVAFLLGTEHSSKYRIQVDEYRFDLVCHRSGSHIGSTYPMLLESNLPV
uniref:poly(U)-specific endoribonuclease-B-like n=1 Tax=Myxine glutinosa TaxID=7769 RepID=UPI003590203A